MKKILMSLLLGLSLFLVACGGDDEPTPPVKKQPNRTVLVYIVSDNSLNSFSDSDVNEMFEGIKRVDTEVNNLLVYVDGNSTPALYHITKDKKGVATKEIIREYDEQVSTSPQVMKEICTKVFTDYPAKSYGLVYWSHGEGWKPMPVTTTRWIGQDKGGDVTDYTNIDELKGVLASVPHLDFLLYDACFMMSVEAAYALRNEVDYIIASPTEIPGPGAPYDAIVPAMFATSNAPIAVAQAYFDTYNALYNDGKGNSDSHWTAGVSIGVLKVNALDALAQASSKALSRAQNLDLTNLKDILFDYDKRSSYTSGKVGYYDMVQLMQHLCSEVDFATWKASFDDAMVYYETTPMNFSSYSGMFFMQGTYGLSHYLPTSNQNLNAAYAYTEWYSAASLASWGW